MKQKTEQEALITLTALCASGEHCSQEMLDKMIRWQLPEEEQARVMEYLVKNNYIDEERFTHAFVMTFKQKSSMKSTKMNTSTCFAPY